MKNIITDYNLFSWFCHDNHKKSDGLTLLLKNGESVTGYLEFVLDPDDDPRDNPTGYVALSRKRYEHEDGTFGYGIVESYDLTDIVGIIECPIGTPV